MRKLLLSFFFLLPASLFAQTGTIRGIITTALSNTPIAGTSVTVQGTNNGTTTDSAGHYEIANLNPGFYNLVFSRTGFRPKTVFEIQVTLAKPAVMDLGLENDSKALHEVTVSASRFNKTLESPVSLRSIGATEIKRNPGGNRDISKVIESLPGVATSVSFRNDIIIRGGSPSENRFYIDGVEIPNINHFSTQGASGGPIGLINVDFIKSVDFYSGAFPADRGNTLSSVFEFHEKEGQKDHEHATFTLSSSDVAATLEGPVGQKTTFIASYRYSYLQELFKALKLPFLPSYQDFQFKITTKLDQKNELTLLGLGAIDRFKLNLNIPHTEQNNFTLANTGSNNQNNYTLGLTYKHYRSRGYSFLVLSRNYLNNLATKFKDNNPSETETLNYSSRETENKFRFENVSREGGYKINFGAGVEMADYSTRTLIVLPYGNNDYSSKISLFKYSLFGQLSRSYLDDRLNLSAGVRADANSYASGMHNMFRTTSPRFSASYSLTDKFIVNFNTGIYYQLPAYTLLGFKDSTGRFVNKNTSYITNRQVVLGVEYNTQKNTKFTVEGFYKLYENYPLVRVLGDTLSLANLGTDFVVVGNDPVVGFTRGKSYGVEFLAQQKLNKGFYGIVALTLFKSTFQNKYHVYIPSSWDTRYILSMTGGRIFKRNWELGVKFRYSGGSPYTPYNIPASSSKATYASYPRGIPDYSRLNSLTLKDFYQLDARLDKKYLFKKFTLNIYADIQNLTNSRYFLPPILVPVHDSNGNIQNQPGNPSHFQTRLLDNKTGNVTPTLGIILEL